MVIVVKLDKENFHVGNAGGVNNCALAAKPNNVDCKAL